MSLHARVVPVLAALAMVATAAGAPPLGSPLAAAPCDILTAAGTPCVAAHSLVRALYGAYAGPLYTVQRASDNATAAVGLLAPGGYANAAAQDAFCAGTDCTILRIFDQSPRGNHLGTAPPGGHVPRADKGVNATRAPIVVGGHRAYGAFFEGGMGYRNDTTSGVATGTAPETLYMLVDGRHYNGGCCFDYGNAETDAHDDGKGTMEAVYFGNATAWGRGSGHGPWVMADLENGLWAGQAQATPQEPIDADFILAMVKGGEGSFTLKGSNAAAGPITTLYSGPRPKGYTPMKKQGAIILGIGGDNSDVAVGTFFEGVMTAGLTSNAVDSQLQASCVAAGWKRA